MKDQSPTSTPISRASRARSRTRTWRIRRLTQPYQDGQQRWDRAYQYLLRWSCAPDCPDRLSSLSCPSCPSSPDRPQTNQTNKEV